MIDANTYSEVYEILSYMDKSTVMKIPIEILENIKERRNKEYISKINPDDLFNKNNINEKTLEILACLDVNYWMKEEKRKDIKKKYILKIRQEELEKKEKYGEKEIFNSKNKMNIQINENTETETISLVKYKKTFFTKIYDKLRSLLKK